MYFANGWLVNVLIPISDNRSFEEDIHGNILRSLLVDDFSAYSYY